MRKILLAAPLLLSPALADSTYLVSKVSIRGSKSVPTADLMAVVQEKPGQRVTAADIEADMHAIEQVLENAHVIGSVAVSAATTGDKSEIIFQITDRGIQQPQIQVVHVQPKLGQQIFAGNTSVSSAVLASADGLKQDDDLTHDGLQRAAKAIVDYYAVVAPKIGIGIATSTKQTDATHVDLTWHITEIQAKAAQTKQSDDSSKDDSSK